jgi:hypothetical protein
MIDILDSLIRLIRLFFHMTNPITHLTDLLFCLLLLAFQLALTIVNLSGAAVLLVSTVFQHAGS